jgi:hypothetical protein
MPSGPGAVQVAVLPPLAPTQSHCQGTPFS